MNFGKHYIEKDGNGGLKFSRSMVAFLALILILGTTLVNVTIANSNTRKDVDYLMDSQAQQDEQISELDSENEQFALDMGIYKTDINYIKGDISEIKEDIKIILERQGG